MWSDWNCIATDGHRIEIILKEFVRYLESTPEWFVMGSQLHWNSFLSRLEQFCEIGNFIGTVCEKNLELIRKSSWSDRNDIWNGWWSNYKCILTVSWAGWNNFEIVYDQIVNCIGTIFEKTWNYIYTVCEWIGMTFKQFVNGLEWHLSSVIADWNDIEAIGERIGISMEQFVSGLEWHWSNLWLDWNRIWTVLWPGWKYLEKVCGIGITIETVLWAGWNNLETVFDIGL